MVKIQNLDPKAGSLAAAIGLDDIEAIFFFDGGHLRLASNGSYLGVTTGGFVIDIVCFYRATRVMYKYYRW